MPDPVRSAAARVGATTRVARLDRAGRREMTAAAVEATRRKYHQAATDQLGPDATPEEIEDLAGRLRSRDLARAGLASAHRRREEAARRRREREDAELAQLAEAAESP